MKFLFWTLGIVNGIEGISHLLTAAIGWHGYRTMELHSWELLTPIIENAVFAVVSLLTGHFLFRFTGRK